MLRKVAIDRAAEKDLIEVWLYSYRRWGEARADAYVDTLDDAIGELAAFPELGDRRDAVVRGLRSRAIASHTIYYSPTYEENRTRRALHESTDPNRHM